jgi:MFS family permease
MANLTSLVSKTAGPERQGEILGLNVSLQSLANVFPPLLAGAIAARFSTETPIAIGAAICLAAWITFGLMTRAAAKA